MCTDNCGGVTVFKGENGVGIVSTVDNNDGTFTITYTDGTTFTTSDLTGPTGATGATGPAGTIPGGGTLNYIAKWTPDGATLGNSQIFDDGENIAVDGSIAVTTKFLVRSDKAFGLSVQQSAIGIAGQYYASADGAGSNVGIQANANSSTTDNTGIQSNVVGTGTDAARGLKVAVSGGLTNYIGEFKDGSEVLGHVLTCVNGTTGAATWQAPATGGSGLTWNTVTGTSPTATLVANNGYIVRDTAGGGTTDLTLPSSGVVVGDIIKIIATKEGGIGSLQTWRILEGRAADVIFYSFFDVFADSESAGVKSTSPLLTFNDLVVGSYHMWKNQTVTLTCIEDLGTGYAWEIELANGKMFS
jgi:hypothetical protein